MFGPMGSGALWGRQELLEQMHPILFGGEMIARVSAEASTWAEVPYRFEAGTPGTVTRMNTKDAARIVHAIKEASAQADIVLVSHHTHERKGMDKELPADFARDFAQHGNVAIRPRALTG